MSRQPITAELVKRVRRMRRNGWTFRAISERLNLPLGSVGRAISIGVSEPPPRRPLPVGDLEAFHADEPSYEHLADWEGIVPPDPDSPPLFCPTCGGKVHQPCLKCQLQGVLKIARPKSRRGRPRKRLPVMN